MLRKKSLHSSRKAWSRHLILEVYVCKRSMKKISKPEISIFGWLDTVQHMCLGVKKQKLQWKTLKWSRQKKHRISFSDNIQTKKETCYGKELEPLQSSALKVTQIGSLHAMTDQKLISFSSWEKSVSRLRDSKRLSVATWKREVCSP